MDISVRVLLIGSGMKGSSSLREYFVRRRCHIECVRSVDQGLSLVKRESFDVVLGPINAEPAKKSHLIASLLGSSSHLFFSLSVEDGSWWLPAVRDGKPCPGTPAFRDRDFLPILDKLLVEGQSAQTVQQSVAS